MILSRKMSCFIFAFLFVLAQFLSGNQLEYSQPLPGGEFAVCEPCWLGRGKCRRICTEDEKVVGNCKMKLFLVSCNL
uniref:Beta-defensin n=1 Tax=Canis lupus familiaris TaxID=9615 RepID=A0A8I3S9K4_CANLF